MRCCPLFLIALSACSMFRGHQTIESSVILAANGKASTTMKGHRSLSVAMRGEGPGGVTFDARSRDGTVIAHGVLTTDSTVNCETSDGELVITFAADAKGGVVAYVVTTQDGGMVTTIPQ